ncbi:MAG: hypothetical protein IKB00_01505 [Bacteroidaceae bacterium]|nr:hypothetical protein [Bacteroidaceae bacterium]
MKKTVFILAAMAAVLVSCDNEETDNIKQEEDVVTVNSDTVFYSGTLLANASSGDCQTPDTKICINPSDKADSTSITIFKAKLAQRMPAMDIIIPGITVNKNGNVTVLAADSTVPLAMGNPFPNYTVTGFEGEILNDEITFSLKFGSTPTSYSGQLLK